MKQASATEQMLMVEQGFEEKVRRLDEILQTFSDEEIRKLALLLERQLDFQKRPPLVEMELIITYRCNLACDYCFMRKQKLCMDRETAIQSIDFLLAYSKDHPFVNVTFFGGEPLLYLGLMEEVAEYVTEKAKEMGKEVHFACTTNGTLVTEKALDFSRRFGFLYLLSLDGSRQAHDLHRKFPNGKGSFEVIASKFPLLKRRQGWLGARVTVTPETIGQLAEGVRELFELGINQFLIGLVHEADWDGEALKEIERQYEMLLQFYLWAKEKNLPLRMTMFEKGLEEVKKERRNLWGCGAGTGRVAVTPDGEIYPCSRFAGSKDERYVIGHIEEGFYKSKLPEALRAGEWARPKCCKCPLAEICSGICQSRLAEPNGRGKNLSSGGVKNEAKRVDFDGVAHRHRHYCCFGWASFPYLHERSGEGMDYSLH